MKIKTGELSGAALDWAVVKAGCVTEGGNGLTFESGKPFVAGRLKIPYEPSTNWGQGGPLIERFGLDLGLECGWRALCKMDDPDRDYWREGNGQTALIAACRAIVAAKLGDEVDVPEGLV